MLTLVCILTGKDSNEKGTACFGSETEHNEPTSGLLTCGKESHKDNSVK